MFQDDPNTFISILFLYLISVMEDPALGERSIAPVKLPPSSACPRPHRCEICQRSFRELATLRKHEQLHRADRPYVCQTCGKSFLWSSNLKVNFCTMVWVCWVKNGSALLLCLIFLSTLTIAIS